MKKLLLIVSGFLIFLLICGLIVPGDEEPDIEAPPAPEEPEEPGLGVTEKELRAIVGVLGVTADDIAEITRTGYGKKIDEDGVLVDDPDFLAYDVVLKNGEEYSQMWINKVMID